MRRFGWQAVLTVAEVVAAFVDFATLKTLSAWLMVSPPPMGSRCGMGGGNPETQSAQYAERINLRV